MCNKDERMRIKDPKKDFVKICLKIYIDQKSTVFNITSTFSLAPS